MHCVLYCTVLYCTVLYCTVLYCTALHCTALHCTALHCTVLYCTVLYCTGTSVWYGMVWYCRLQDHAGRGRPVLVDGPTLSQRLCDLGHTCLLGATHAHRRHTGGTQAHAHTRAHTGTDAHRHTDTQAHRHTRVHTGARTHAGCAQERRRKLSALWLLKHLICLPCYRSHMVFVGWLAGWALPCR
eukprot:COSAG06_NODE_456_length_15511_cov_7.299312_14_plen_185_part_00